MAICPPAWLPPFPHKGPPSRVFFVPHPGRLGAGGCERQRQVGGAPGERLGTPGAGGSEWAELGGRVSGEEGGSILAGKSLGYL